MTQIYTASNWWSQDFLLSILNYRDSQVRGLMVGYRLSWVLWMRGKKELDGRRIKVGMDIGGQRSISLFRLLCLSFLLFPLMVLCPFPFSLPPFFFLFTLVLLCIGGSPWCYGLCCSHCICLLFSSPFLSSPFLSFSSFLHSVF